MEERERERQGATAAASECIRSGVAVGSSKRKSRPVKRVIHTDDDGGDGELADVDGDLPSSGQRQGRGQNGGSSNGTQTGIKQNGSNGDATTAAVNSTELLQKEAEKETAMDQAELFKRLTEMLVSQQQMQSSLSSAPNYLSPQILLSSLTPSSMSPSLFNSTTTPSDAFLFPSAVNSNNLLQAAALFSSGLFNGSVNSAVNATSSPTAPTNKKANNLQTPMANVNVAMLQQMLKGERPNSPNSRSSPNAVNSNGPGSSQIGGRTGGGPKRKLFEGKEEGNGGRADSRLSSANVKMMRQTANNISKEERIDLDDLEMFASMFKKQRIKFGFTQGDVGVALGKRYGTDFSQTTISRFEALNLSFKNMCKLRPLLKEWLADAEAALANGASLNELLDRGTSAQHGGPSSSTALHNSTPSPSATSPDGGGGSFDTLTARLPFEPHIKRRRKRTNLDMNQRAALDAFFIVNPRPDHERMTEIANSLELDRDVVRVWFCNRRQKVRRHDEPDGMGGVNSLFPFNDLPSSSTFPDSTSEDTLSENGQPSESAGPSTPLGTGPMTMSSVTLEQLLKEAGVVAAASTHNNETGSVQDE